jgi:hypothetical protein
MFDPWLSAPQADGLVCLAVVIAYVNVRHIATVFIGSAFHNSTEFF